MKYLRYLFLAPLLMAFQCESDDTAVFDHLDATGLLGRWEIQDEIINGNITDMIPKCCKFLKFNPDDDISDNQGLLTYTDSQGLVNSGTFEVNLDNQTILFIDNENDEFIFDFSINDSQENLTVDFTVDGTNYTQTWIRIQ
jgi:hypothetical protein